MIWVAMITSADSAPWWRDVTIVDLARAGRFDKATAKAVALFGNVMNAGGPAADAATPDQVVRHLPVVGDYTHPGRHGKRENMW